MAPQRKTNDPEVDSSMLPSSKPIPASAILTFVPDNEVKKIVTRPQVENNNSPSSDKQMVLRDRRTAGQDSPYNRKRPVMLQHVETDEDVKIAGSTDGDADGTLASSSLDAGLAKEGSHVKDSVQVMSKREEEERTEVSSIPESGKDGQMPSEAKTVIKTEGQDSTNVSKDDTLLDKLKAKNSSSSNEVVEPNMSVSQNGISTQAGSTSKTELPALATIVKDTKPSVAVSSSAAVSQSKLGVLQTRTAGNTVPAAKPAVEEPVFRLGSEANYSSYINQFTSNPLAVTKQQQLEQRDKKRSVTHKFSLNEFKWHGEVCGSKDVVLNTLRFSIVGLENSIATSFMHPSWPVQRSTWVKAVHLSKTPQEFAAALSFLESSIRPICYLPVWNDAVGHVELHRVMSEARQAGTKKKDHKEEEEEPEVEHKGFGK